MTEATPTPGASNIINPPAPTDPAAAGVRRMELMKDPNFMKRVEAKDAAAFEEHTRLWRIEHGMPATPQPPQVAGDVFKEMEGRSLQQAEQHFDGLLEHGFDGQQAYEYMNGRPAPIEEIEHHKREIRRLMNDTEFKRKYLAGDTEAKRIMRLHHVGSVMPVGTLEQIAAWERKHYGNQSS